MNKILVTAIAAAAFGAPALAADLPVKAPPLVVATVYNWSGIYGGIGVGWMYDHESVLWPNTLLPINSFSHSGSKVFLDGHVGAQWQFGTIVFGVEAAADTFSKRDHTGSPQTGCPNAAFTCQAGVANIWTIGPKLGYAFDRFMVYGTGGYARGTVESNAFLTATGVFQDSLDQTAKGWFAGGGIDMMALHTNFADIIVGVEYKHIDLGTVTFLSPADAFNPAGANRRDASTRIDTISARLDVKFNPWVGPVVARY